MTCETWVKVYFFAYGYPVFPSGSDGKESACNAGDQGLIPGWGRYPGEAKWLPTPVFWPGQSHGRRSLAGPNPWGRKESDMVERLPHTHWDTIPRQLTFLNAGKTGLLSKVCNRVWDQFANGWDFTQREVVIWKALEDYKLPINKRQIELAPVSSLADSAPW